MHHAITLSLVIVGRVQNVTGLRDDDPMTYGSPAHMHVEVRPRSVEDLVACVGLLRIVHVTDGYPLAWPSDPERWIAPRRERCAWIARNDDGSVLGHVALHFVEGHSACQLWCDGSGLPPDCLVAVSRLLVLPSARRRGLGSALVTEATAHAHALGLRPVLDVAQDNYPAVRLYEQSGWRRVGKLGINDHRQIPVFAFVGPEPGRWSIPLAECANQVGGARPT